jgi:SNF2 family DNA or RNA helicase
MVSPNLPSSASDDPWDWSVTQVVQEFCRNDRDRPAWCSPTDHLPNPTDLEEGLRENDVTGELMLTAVTKEVLRDELHIKSMGQRYAVEKGINFLRSRSQKFQASAPAAIAPSFVPVQSWLQASGPPYDHPSNIGGSLQSPIPLGEAFDNPRFGMQAGPFGTSNPNGLNTNNAAQVLTRSVPPPARSVSPKETVSNEVARTITITAEPPATIGEHYTPSAQHKLAVKVPRRIAPTFVAHIDKNAKQSAALFGEDNNITGDDEPAEEESDGEEFEIHGAHIANGQRIQASRRMKRYLALLDSDRRRIRFTQQNDTSSEQDDTKSNALQEHQHGYSDDDEFKQLLDRYPPKPDDEDALAAYGESGDEAEFDDETWEEIEQDIAEDRNAARLERALPLQEVNSVIDEVMKEFVSTWQGTKLAKVQAKGYRLWKKANRDGRVQSEVAAAQYWVQRLEQSLVKIRQAITRESWSNARALRQQCQSLEASISQQQEHQYNISILGKKVAPPRPDRKSIRYENHEPVDLPEGEILLESESDLSLSNFIDDDNDDPQAIPTSLSHQLTAQPLDVEATEESDDVISPEAMRIRFKTKVAPVDSRKNPFIETQSSSSKESSSPGADSDLDLPALLPQSQYENVGHEEGMPIDLISSSEPPTPAKNDADTKTELDLESDQGTKIYLKPEKDAQPPTPQKLKLTRPKPLLHDVNGIGEMEWDAIENSGDSRRALAKAVYSLSAAKALRMRKLVKEYTRGNLQEILKQGFRAILKKHAYVEGIDENHWEAARNATLLFTSYCLARKVVDEPHLEKDRMLKAQGKVDSGGIPFFMTLKEIFSKYPQNQLSKPVKRKLNIAASQEMDVLTTDSDSPTAQQTPGKRKRRRVEQSQAATTSQRAGQLRVQEQQRRMASIDQKFQSIPRNMKDPASYAVGMKEPIIYLDPKIGGKVKAHQVDGIRFMWRELMTDKKGQGCLLAHTMGLGKTMQVISLLVTIAQATKSLDAGILSQIPDDLRVSKVLILCPPSLTDNWYEEILMWRPDPTILGDLYKITQKTPLPDRAQEIGQWASTGGILIISYDLFRGLIDNKAKSKIEGSLGDKEHARVLEHLLNHPSIIIADEAHKLKNTEASISKATSRFKSTRRIALTGSPLANSLDEYFAMIDWIAPGYLGNNQQFRSKYATPISEGLYNDSDTFARRNSLRKLHVLKRNLDPKISRADITAIADDLPSKTEFFITVPLTKLQTKAYNLYIDVQRGDGEAKFSGTARLWDWLAILSLLCSHPSTFLNKLDDRQYGRYKKTKKTKAKAEKSTDDTDDAAGFRLSTDIELASAGLSADLVKQQHKIFRAIEDSDRLEAPSLSHRSQIVCDIIQLSVAAGDKVLLFSHSIPTLNYLEGTISGLGYSTCRLDGSTPATKRQEAVKEFNKETATFNVFFISTRAGGLGLNLQGANRVILFDYGFNPVWEEQAVGRAYRLGQRRPVFVYRLRAGGTFEELIYNKAIFKTQLSARVVDQKNPMRYASKKVADYLFHVKEVPQEDLGPYFGKDLLVLDRILSRANCIRDITLTETFQKEDDESLTPEEVRQANDELKDEQEMRTDPAGYHRKLAAQQAALLRSREPSSNFMTRPSPSSSMFVARPSPSSATFIARPQPSTSTLVARTPPQSQDVPLRPSLPVSYQVPRMSATQTTTNNTNGYVSRPEAISGPQQTENVFWDQRATPHLQHRLENVIGIPPPHNLIPRIQQSYPSPTTEARPSQVRKAPGSPPLNNGQVDGAVDFPEDDPDTDLAECKTQ